MDTKEMKAMLKPLIKQCIREVLMEEGLGKLVTEAKTSTVVEQKQPIQQKKEINEQQKVELANRKKMLDEIGRSGYVSSNFDPFAGTKPLTESQAKNGQANTGPLKDIDPSDPGIDISSLVNGSSKKVWKALVGGKGK